MSFPSEAFISSNPEIREAQKEISKTEVSTRNASSQSISHSANQVFLFFHLFSFVSHLTINFQRFLLMKENSDNLFLSWSINAILKLSLFIFLLETISSQKEFVWKEKVLMICILLLMMEECISPFFLLFSPFNFVNCFFKNKDLLKLKQCVRHTS